MVGWAGKAVDVVIRESWAGRRGKELQMGCSRKKGIPDCKGTW
jgi:hypothetical protein